MRAPTAVETNIRAVVDAALGASGVFEATKTQLGKSILETTQPLRDWLAHSGVHDFDSQLNGPGHKVVRPCLYFDGAAMWETPISFNRAQERGDPRMWIPALRGRAAPGDLISLSSDDGLVVAVDLTGVSRDDPNLSVLATWLTPGTDPVAAGTAGARGATGSGMYATSAAERAAMEAHSRAVAIVQLTRRGLEFVEATEGSVPYDLVFRDGAQTVFVEVKCTRGPGDLVLLTAGEVEHAAEAPHSILFVVAEVETRQESDGSYSVSGGVSSMLDPWRVDRRALIPLQYRYRLPEMLRAD